MSSPFIGYFTARTFSEDNSCSPCPAGTIVSSLTSVPNDEISCQLCDVGTFSTQGNTSCQLCATGTCSVEGSAACSTCAKMPDGCKGKALDDRLCYPRKAVDELIAQNADGSGTHATYGPMKDWDMSLVTDMSQLFRLKRTMNADLSRWDVSSVTTMKKST